MYASSLDQREVDRRVQKAIYNQGLIKHARAHTHTPLPLLEKRPRINAFSKCVIHHWSAGTG